MLVNRETILELAPQLKIKSLTVRFTAKALYFSVGVKTLMRIGDKEKRFSHFEILDGKTLLFYFNKNVMGFPVLDYYDNRGFSIRSLSLVSFLKEKLNLAVPADYYVQEANGVKIAGVTAYEILIEKPIKKFGR